MSFTAMRLLALREAHHATGLASFDARLRVVASWLIGAHA